MRKGWFRIPGVQDGDRDVATQLKGLAPALAAARGKNVLDLGSAEGMISREFAIAGARRVFGVEIIAEHVRAAEALCRKFPQCQFLASDVMNWIAELEHRGLMPRFDIVLALAVYHKVRDPARMVAFSADVADELLVVRLPGGGTPEGVYSHSRPGNERVDVAKICASRGFVLERVERGPDAGLGVEYVLYFRRR